MTVAQPIRVFVSYAHERALAGHRERALELAQSLRLRGVEAMIDQFVEHDPPFWPRWMTDQVRGADHVLCLASSAYKERVEPPRQPRRRSGGAVGGRAHHRGSLTGSFRNAYRKFIAVVPAGGSPDHIPDVLLPVGRSYYVLPGDDEDLYRRLTGQPRVVPAPLGAVLRLGPG